MPAPQAFRQSLPDIAVIDVGLGEDIEGGCKLCRELRDLAPEVTICLLIVRHSRTPVAAHAGPRGRTLSPIDALRRGGEFEARLSRSAV